MRFFRGDPIHGETEEMMIVVPLFEKEKYTEPVRRKDIDVRSYLAGEGLENMIYRLVSYQNCEEAIKASIHLNKKKIFFSEEHRKLFKEILEGYRGKLLRSSRRYLAAVFLLSADKDLWESVEQNVTDMGIFFDNIHLKGLSTDQYILLHIAEQMYGGRHFINAKELVDSEIVKKEIFITIVNAYLLRTYGAGIFKMEREEV